VDSGDTVDKYRRSDRSYLSGDRSSESRANFVRGIVFRAVRGIIIYARSLRNSDGPQPQGEGSFEGHSGLALCVRKLRSAGLLKTFRDTHLDDRLPSDPESLSVTVERRG
jgi:hypothetical protein